MPGEPKMRMPYGPGWEDTDWTPHEPPPEVAPADGARPVVRSLAQFMEIVRRVARPRRRPIEAGHEPSLQTRRWVMAGGAGFVALAALPRRRGLGAPGPEAEAADTDDARPAE